MLHRRSLVRLAVPNYVALLSGVITGMIDVAWVGRLGPGPVAAVAVATSVENALLGVALLVNGGVTVVLSGRLGAGDTAAARATVRAGWWIYAALTPIVVLAGWALRHRIAAAFLGDAAAAEQAAAYFTVLFPAVAIFYAQQVVDATFAGHGDTRTPMRLALLANGLLLVLDPVLIYGLGPVPAFGVTGAAAATALGRAVALVTGLILVRRRHPAIGATAPLRPALRAVTVAGAPIAGDFLVRMAGALTVIGVVSRSGVAAVAAYGIGMKLLYFATMSFYALRNAVTIHTPRTLSALEPEARAPQRRAIGGQALGLALAAGTVATVLFAAAAPALMRLFSTDPQVVAAGVVLLRCVGGYLIPIAGVIALGGLLMGSGSGSRLFAVTVAGMATQSVLAWVFAGALGLPGVWLAMAVGGLLQLALVLAAAGLRAPAPAPVPSTPVAIQRR
ncbi:MATE family efflux transporter [Actinoplanes regularis]|uniref:Probable multidrug resistance protein NorM n=1 Tax=Actinoplanes regularis TaxID=52697 RepID=A0A239D160_9ACTN|nr:MATE family efflux transporter [Actinoplanes regularis]GIE88464.1 putative DNA-damage-inducible protein F [Actinoplanes regularis]SNS25949.1 putative efflux protein, MATE family [Actinoplanes regularis]